MQLKLIFFNSFQIGKIRLMDENFRETDFGSFRKTINCQKCLKYNGLLHIVGAPWEESSIR